MPEPLVDPALDDTDRRRVLDAEDRLLAAASLFRHPELQARLDALVEQAARTTGFPMAMVSIVLHRTQRYLAQFGAPPDLDSSRTTDRCVSFCQHVVGTAAPFLVEDALETPGLRRELTELYGVRAYFGVPLHVDGQTVGALCVVDLQPRTITPALQASVTAIAELVDELFHHATTQARRARELTGIAVRPAFSELRNILCRVSLGTGLLESALADLRGGQELLAAAARGELSTDQLGRNATVLGEGALAIGDAHELLTDHAHEIDLAARTLVAIEQAVAPQQGGTTTIHQVIQAALLNAESETRMIGGVAVEPFDLQLALEAEPSEAIAALTTTIDLLARRLPPADRPPIRIRITADEQTIEVTIRTPPLAPEAERALQHQLGGLLEVVNGITACFASDSVTLRFRSAEALPEPLF